MLCSAANILRGLVFACSLLSLAIASNLDKRAACNADNCLRSLRATEIPFRSADSNSFCSRYIKQHTPTITVTTTTSFTKPDATISTETSLETERTTTTVDGEALIFTETIIKRTVPTAVAIPSYLRTACASSPSRVSSACSCFIGATASPTTVFRTRTNTIGRLRTVTKLSTIIKSIATTTTLVVEKTTTETTTRAGPISTETVLRCDPNGLISPACVFLRIEGRDSTIFEDFIVSDARDITTPLGGTHKCDGTNGGANPVPGGTGITPLDQASKDQGFEYDGTYNDQFQDYFIQSIGDTSQTSTQSWGILRDGKFTYRGSCQEQFNRGQTVLWAFDAFNAQAFLHASTSPGLTYPDTSSYSQTVTAGLLITIYILNAENGNPVSGATIGGQVTDGNGQAIITLSAPGKYSLKATKPQTIRSNFVNFIVKSA